MVSIIKWPDGSKSMLDVGFGGDGPVQFLPLLADVVLPNIRPQEMRLTHENIQDNLDPMQRLWVYQVRKTPEDEWKPKYCFSEVEFLPQDFKVMNFWTSTSPRSWFTQQVMIVKMLQDEGSVYGQLILLGGDVKLKKNGKTEIIKVCKTEAERLEALAVDFHIELSVREKRGISGLVTELK